MLCFSPKTGEKQGVINLQGTVWKRTLELNYFTVATRADNTWCAYLQFSIQIITTIDVFTSQYLHFPQQTLVSERRTCESTSFFSMACTQTPTHSKRSSRPWMFTFAPHCASTTALITTARTGSKRVTNVAINTHQLLKDAGNIFFEIGFRKKESFQRIKIRNIQKARRVCFQQLHSENKAKHRLLFRILQKFSLHIGVETQIFCCFENVVLSYRAKSFECFFYCFWFWECDKRNDHSRDQCFIHPSCKSCSA